MSDATVVLSEVSAIVQEAYYSEYLPQYERMRGILGRIVKLAGEPVSGDGKTWQNEIQKYDSVRGSTDMLSPFSSPGTFVPFNLKVRWNEGTAASNDFLKLSGSGQVSLWAVTQAERDGTIIPLAKNILDGLTKDFGEKNAIYQNIGRDARLALINGTPKNNDATTYAAATTYTADSTTCRIQVDTGQFAFLKPGVVLDFYTAAASLSFSGAVVTDINYGDQSIGLGRYNSGSTATFNLLADNDEIFFSSARGAGAYSVAAWFSTPTASESFIGGADRTSVNYRWMIPTAYAATSSGTVPIQTSYFDNLANAMMLMSDGEVKLTPVVTTVEIAQSLRTKIGNDAFIPFTALGTEMQKRYASFGISDLNYQHPRWGTLQILGDTFCTPNVVRFFKPGTWLALQYGAKGLQFMNDGDIGMWRRQPDTSPGNGFGMIYRCEAYETMCTYCTRPQENGQITNVAA